MTQLVPGPTHHPVLRPCTDPLHQLTGLGDAALWCDPLAVDDLARAVAIATGDDAVRARLVAAGRERAARYSWARTADELVALYRRAAARRRGQSA